MLRAVCLVPESPNVVVRGRVAHLNAYRLPVAILSAEGGVVC